MDYVGLNNCVGVYNSSPSGQYINTLFGITWENIDALSEDEQQDWEGVWADVQRNAAIRFQLDIKTSINGCYQIDKECDYEAIICDEDNMELLTSAWMYLLGVYIMFERLYTSRLNKYTTVNREDAKELKELYQTEYETFLKQAVLLLDVTSCELCCGGGNPESVVYLP